MKTTTLSKEQVIDRIKGHAEYGGRILEVVAESEKPKTIWAGLGNRAGLHSYADTITAEKWEKSGERFIKRLDNKIQAGAVFQLQTFENTCRDRGRWRTWEVLCVE